MKQFVYKTSNNLKISNILKRKGETESYKKNVYGFAQTVFSREKLLEEI